MTTETLDLVLPDIPRIHTALAEWLSCIVYVCYAGGIIGLNQEKPTKQGFALI